MNVSEGQRRPTLEDAFDALRRSEAQLRAFIDELPALAWCLLPDGSIEFFNQQWHTYTGLSAEEMCGSGWKSAVHTDDVERLESWWRDLVQSGEPGNTEVRFRRLDGEYRWVQISAVPVRDEKGNVVRWYGINIDKSSIGRSITDAISQSRLAAALLQETWAGHRIVELEGPHRVTPNEIAAAFANLLGHPVKAGAVPRETWESLFKSQGMRNPTPRIEMLDGFNQGWIEFEGGQAGSLKGDVALGTVLRALIQRERKL